jgi:recombination protein RecT
MNTEVAMRPNPMQIWQGKLDARAADFRTALPDHISVDKFIRVIKTAALQNHDLVACDFGSFRTACMKAAAMGLLPDGTEGVILPFKDHAQFIPMVQGLLKLFRNSGQFRHVNAGIVYEGEEFAHWIDEAGEHFKHIPGDERDPKKVRRFYATATTKDGAFFISDMTPAEVGKREAQSRARREDAPWKKWPLEMAKKTVLKDLAKLLPKSSDLEERLREDESEEGEAERAPLELVHSEAERPGTAGATLDAFAEPTGAQFDPETGEVPAEPKNEPGEAASEPEHVPGSLLDAYQRGRDDKAKGHGKKAIPSEYRDNTKLAIAWQAGYDDNPMPEFKTPSA